MKKGIVKLSVLSSVLLAVSACDSGGSSSPNLDRHAVVANAGDNTVTIFDGNTLEIETAALALTGVYPHEVTLSADNRTAYVMNRDSANISIVDILAGTETGTITLSGTSPAKAVVAPDGFLYVTYLGSNFISKVDIAAATPVESSIIGISMIDSSAIDVTPDGSTLYVGSTDSSLVSKIDLATATEVGTVSAVGMSDMEIDASGMAYISPVIGGDIVRLDTETDTLASAIGVGSSSFDMTDIALYQGKVYAALNDGTGGVVSASTGFSSSGYDYGSADDSSYDVNLPFTFNFRGTDYTTVTMNSNGVVSFAGYVSYDQGVENNIGFAPNNEDLDSGNLLSYSSRVYSDHAVFQWLTSTNNDEPDVNDFTIFEVVLYQDGTAQFNYLQSGPEAITEDDGYSYGVGDGSGTPLVNLRTQTGMSPFEHQRQSYFWDPATPNVMTEVTFTWSGTGVHFQPAMRASSGGVVDGVAATDSYIFMPVPRDYQGGSVNEVVVYKRSTGLRTASPVTVGSEPRAIAVAELPR